VGSRPKVSFCPYDSTSPGNYGCLFVQYLTPSPLSYYVNPLLQMVADVGFQNFGQIFWVELENYISKDLEGRGCGLI
jgi:hypothetical protein